MMQLELPSTNLPVLACTPTGNLQVPSIRSGWLCVLPVKHALSTCGRTTGAHGTVAANISGRIFPARADASSSCSTHAIYHLAGQPCWGHFKYSIRAAVCKAPLMRRITGLGTHFFASSLRYHQGIALFRELATKTQSMRDADEPASSPIWNDACSAASKYLNRFSLADRMVHLRDGRHQLV